MNPKISFKMFLYFFIVFVFLLSLFLLNGATVKYNIAKELEKTAIGHINIGEKYIKVELALTEQAKEKGLSDKIGLKEDEGMLFVFDHKDKYPFWMKDMDFSIDIIWISEDLRIVAIKKDASPSSYPESFYPTEDAKYVLEVISGFSEKNNLKEGDSVKFLP